MMNKELLDEKKKEELPPEQQKTTAAPKKKRRFPAILFGILYFLTVAILSLTIWYKNTFNIKFNDFLFTLLSPLAGTGLSMFFDILKASLVPAVIALIPYGIFMRMTRGGQKKGKILRKIGAALILVTLVFSFVFAFFALRIPEYLATYGQKSEIYETEYVDPKKAPITDLDGNAQNLIYIYLESMETTYASKEAGGEQDGVNYMPHMTEMAKENISFSDCEGLGGFRSVTGTGWTMGALLGTTSGVPFSLEIFGASSHNSLGRDGKFLDDLTTLGDILKAKGYKQEFLIGSERSFAGTDTYVTIHGDYEIFDLQTARDRGYIPENYNNGFWGFEDKYLYEIAKDEILDLAAGDDPFNFTMMTIDPHHVGGYLCDLCGDEYDGKLANVIACADRQLYEFVEWCKKQDFYENTTIVITGDHPRMDTQLVKNTPFYERTIYNCILNAATEPPVAYKNRVFTSLDMFPTTLAAMGFEIEGERLGLGTNLFSVVPTLCEKMGEGEEGYNLFDEEVKKYSDYYKNNFLEKDK